MSVVTLRPNRRPAPKLRPLKVIGEAVTAEERGAADTLLRNAQALQRLFDRAWVTPAALANAPGLIEAAQAALDDLKELV